MAPSARQLTGPTVYYLVDIDESFDVGGRPSIVMTRAFFPDFNAGLYRHKGRVCGQGVISSVNKRDFAPHEQLETIVEAGGIPAILRPRETVMVPLYTDQQNSDDAYCAYTWFPTYFHPDGSWTTGVRASEPTVIARFPDVALTLDPVQYDVAPLADSPVGFDFMPYAEDDDPNVEWVAGDDGLTIVSHPGRVHMAGSVTPVVTALSERDLSAWIFALCDFLGPPNTAPLDTLHNLVAPLVGGGSLLEGADEYQMLHCSDTLTAGLVLTSDEEMRQRAIYRSAWPDTDDGPPFVGTVTDVGTPVAPGDVTSRAQRFPFGGASEVYRISATVTLTDPVVGTQGGFFFADNAGRFWLFVLRCLSLAAPPDTALEVLTYTYDGVTLTPRTAGGAFTLPLGSPRTQTVEMSLDFRPAPILGQILTFAVSRIPGGVQVGGTAAPMPISFILDDGVGNWGLYKGDPGGRAIDSVVTIGDVTANRMDPTLPFPTDQDFNTMISAFPPNQALNFTDVGWRYVDVLPSEIEAGPPLEAQARLHEHFVGNTHLR